MDEPRIYLPRPERWQLSLQGLLIVIAIVALLATLHSDPFTDQLRVLENQDATKVGRDPLVKAYEQLIARYPRHPLRAKAQLELASLWQSTIPALGIKADPQAEIRCLKQACESARRGSSDWFDARFRLAGQIRLEQPQAARRILDEVMQHAAEAGPGESAIAKVRALYDLQCIAAYQDEYDKAEEICLRLQNWDTEAADMPTGSKLGEVFQWIQNSAQSMMMTYAGRRDLIRSQRKAKIEELASKLRVGRKHAETSAEYALQYMGRLHGD